MVHGTWDVDLARELIRTADPDHYNDDPSSYTLPSPVRTWLRTRPASPAERECDGYSFYYIAPKVPGERGAFRAVEFPEPLFTGQKTVFPMGLPAKDVAA